MFVQNGVLQITEDEIPKKRNLRYLIEALGQNAKAI